MSIISKTPPEERTLYSSSTQLHERQWLELARRPPVEAATCAGAQLIEGRFLLRVCAVTVSVDPEERCCLHVEEDGITPILGAHVGYQRGLAAVSWLSRALGADAAGRWVSFRELPGGASFFRGPHEVNTASLEERFGECPGELLPAARGMKGALKEGADAAVSFTALPSIPMKALLWGTSDEFTASAQLLIDARAHLGLALDVLWALSNVAVADLVRGST